MRRKNLPEAPDFMKRVVERSRRGPNDIGFAEIAFHPGLLERAEQLLRMLMDKNRKLATARFRFVRRDHGQQFRRRSVEQKLQVTGQANGFGAQSLHSTRFIKD